MSDLRRAKILAVEDNPDTLTLLGFMLRAHFDMVCVGGFDDAMEAVDRQAVDLFLLDINLGEIRTGVDLLHALRARPDHAGTPAVALTAYAMPGDRERFLEAGFNAYVSKPFTRQDLMGALAALLARPA